MRTAISGYIGAPADQIVAGAGSDELIDLVVRALVQPGQRILSCPPTFGMYKFTGDVNGVPVDEAPRRDDFTLDLAALLAALRDDTALVILAAPNNPSGTPLGEDDLRALLATGVTVVVDEAYAEFASGSFVEWRREHPRLIILRTFSKWAGLAGLRVGYGIFHPAIADVLMRIKPPYNLNRAAERAVLAALARREELTEQVRQIVAERERLRRGIADLGWLTPLPSEANFLLCRVADGGSTEASGAAARNALARRGVFIRYFSAPRLQPYIRISVPRPDQTPVLLERLAAAGRDLGLG